MSLLTVILSVFAIVVLLPLTASWLMGTILKNTDNEGLYEDE